MSFALRILPLLATLGSTVALAACGDGSETSDPAPSSGGSSSSSGTSNEQDAARVKLLQCVREQGIDVPDTDVTGEAFAQLSATERQQMEAALQGPCRKYASQAFGQSEAHGPEFLDDLTKFTVCLRKNGADVPDPDPDAPFSVLHSLDQSDPTIAAAISACRDKLPSMNGGG